jgi:hypothetical protein
VGLSTIKQTNKQTLTQKNTEEITKIFHICILAGCGAVCMTHFDGYGSDKAVKDIMVVMNELCKNKPFGK